MFFHVFFQVITLSDDHVVRVWDLRNHKCVQALGHQGEWAMAGRQGVRAGRGGAAVEQGARCEQPNAELREARVLLLAACQG